MTTKKTATPTLPNWLTTTNENAMPFRKETQQHLLAVAQEDPRVIDIIARIEAKTEKYIAEHPQSNPYNRSSLLDACPEWQWAKRICRSSSKVLNELHAAPHMTMAEESDIIRLAAYRQDHSLAHFFIEYAGKASLAGDTSQKAGMSEEERRNYAESIRMIYPVACDLQPKVALAYAPHVMHALRPYGLEEDVQDAYLKMARTTPSDILTRPEQFDSFQNKSAILEAATKARAERTERGDTLTPSEAVAETNLVALEELAAKHPSWAARATESRAAAAGWKKQ